MVRRARSDRGSVVAGWLVKVVAGIAVFTLIGFDAVAILTAHLSATDNANAAAEAANGAWSESNGSVQAAYNAAVAYAERHNETCPAASFSITRQGAVHLTLTGTATTLLVGRIGPLKKLAEVHATGEATTPQD